MTKKIIIILLIFLLTGCYDYKELNTIAILTASEIIKADNEYIINAQVVNPQSKDTVNVQAPFIIYTGKGKTIQEAYRKIKLQSSRFLYPNHLQILIINENIAKNEINDIIDFFLRIPHIRSEFHILIGKDENILNITTPIDDISGTSILETMQTNNKYLGITNLITFNELANMSIDKNQEIILPSIETINYNETSDTTENTESTKVNSLYQLSTLAVFKNNELLGYLSEKESITYNVIKNKVDTTLVVYECEKDKYMTIEATKIKSEIKYENKEININIKMSGTINETTCSIALNKDKNIKKLEKNISKYIEEEVKNNINNIIKKYNSDIFGFIDTIYKQNHNDYKSLKDNWYKGTYQNIKVNINCSLQITGKGNVLEGNNEKN